MRVPDAPGPINIGTGVETSINGLYRRLCRAVGLDAASARYGSAVPGEQRRSVLDVTLARRVLGWSPSTSLDVGLVQTLEHFKREIVAR
jgi:UDP-glucose 4-epimerase